MPLSGLTMLAFIQSSGGIFASPVCEVPVKQPIVIHTEEDYEQVQQRVAELSASADSANKESELEALAEAMLAWELRRDTAEE